MILFIVSQIIRLVYFYYMGIDIDYQLRAWIYE